MSYDEAIKIMICVEYDGGMPDEAARYEEAKARILAQRRWWQEQPQTKIGPEEPPHAKQNQEE